MEFHESGFIGLLQKKIYLCSMKEGILNRYNIDSWKEDSWVSVDYYNNWFMQSAPDAYKHARKGVLDKVKDTFNAFDLLKNITPENLLKRPEALSILRACMAPPLAIDRLAGLCLSGRTLITRLENGKLPSKSNEQELLDSLVRICEILNKLRDTYLFPWIENLQRPSIQTINRSAAIIADRITGALADPIIRNSQEQRQLKSIKVFLEEKGYDYIHSSEIVAVKEMPPKTFSFHINCPVHVGEKVIKMPIDVAIQTEETKSRHIMPLLVECKSAGDFANTNKRRKEEAVKALQLRHTYGSEICFILFLCGYFDTSYLGYEASEGIDWVWEHRITDFNLLGV